MIILYIMKMFKEFDLKVDIVNISSTSQQSDHCSVQSDVSVPPENVLINNIDPLMILLTNSKRLINYYNILSLIL